MIDTNKQLETLISDIIGNVMDSLNLIMLCIVELMKTSEGEVEMIAETINTQTLFIAV